MVNVVQIFYAKKVNNLTMLEMRHIVDRSGQTTTILLTYFFLLIRRGRQSPNEQSRAEPS